MGESYLNLKKKYDALLLDHSKLKDEYSENFMIQSMNDMKTMYEEKEGSLEISESKNNKLQIVNYHLSDCVKTANIMLETTRRNIKELNNNGDNNDNRIDIFEIELKIRFIQEILEESIRIKNELLYFSPENLD